MHPPRGTRDETGAVSTHVAIMPVVMMLLFLVVQVCLWYYGRVVAYGAAQHGLEAARAYDGDTGVAEDFVRQFIGQSGGLEVTSITIDRNSTHATVEIEAEALDVMPFLDAHITVRREARIEAPPG
jgi:hypothetical protein